MILLRLNLPCTFCQRVNMKILGINEKVAIRVAIRVAMLTLA